MIVRPQFILTVWQPYATLIARGWKNREFRSWVPSWVDLPFTLAIHAAKRPMDGEALARRLFESNATAFSETPDWLRQCADVISDRRLCPMKPPGPVTANTLWPELIAGKGHIVGVVDVVGFEQDGSGFAWVLENVRQLVEPMLWRGQQGIKRFDQDVHVFSPICDQCGQKWEEWACGPTHAVSKQRMGLI